MKYCVHYYKKFPYINDIDELIIDYSPQNTALPKLLQKLSDKSIILNITKETVLTQNDTRLLAALARSYKFRFSFYFENKIMLNLCKQNSFPFFFCDHAYTWDIFTGLISEKPTDIYITDEFCFELKAISKICKDKGISVRVFPNVAQSRFPSLPAPKKFFIRPQAIKLYEDLIDVCELFGNNARPDLYSIYYKIYAVDQLWYGDLQECIVNFKEQLDSNRLPLDFDRYRILCGHRCMKDSECNLCNSYKTLTQAMKEKNILIAEEKV